jgi:hypothetical protein
MCPLRVSTEMGSVKSPTFTYRYKSIYIFIFYNDERYITVRPVKWGAAGGVRKKTPTLPEKGSECARY